MTGGTDAGVVPEVYVDEITPPPRPTPDDWIVRKDGGAMIDNDPNLDGDDETSEDLGLKHGLAVTFFRLYTYPDATLTFPREGDWRCDPPAPEGADYVMVEDEPETMSGSVSELVANADINAAPGNAYTLNFYSWVDEIWSYDAEAGKFTRGAA
ncbi:hypothetical protein SAMN06265338_1243 [Rhodoblastus acidophilus]|uniref:Uncharacterized protein n=1 Tax=Rhodoblastus acidophilus TaxID=1074 RepID=A0A212SBS3_RHOAC|nr:hypothetical protein [Rhodoblastus acidophilus]MCW2315279.1 hypothetical protein [Rhodoblastus acidophilus]PPQ35401.1 hypothetical protein CKO16_20580 [Rhodoblastus acidophilus]RAI17026.1 hypothetical protein CH337_18195 [Rhodoblastus acidophilus]SNB82990.1 hypothetical protein SAMN06265338_1243 [Rhodoblastus acidophilus]